jgi:hypothetical protein
VGRPWPVPPERRTGPSLAASRPEIKAARLLRIFQTLDDRSPTKIISYYFLDVLKVAMFMFCPVEIIGIETILLFRRFIACRHYQFFDSVLEYAPADFEPRRISL